ncbi:MAG: hypothetical protein GC154_14335 [bacterium]|nr:hypothetical protein [bacterium]
MDLEDLRRVIRLSFLTALGLALFSGFIWGTEAALGVAIGGCGAALNLWALQIFFVELLGPRRAWRLMMLAQLKIIGVYGLGALLFLTVRFSVLAAILGFQIPFVLLLQRALRAAWLEHKR